MKTSLEGRKAIQIHEELRLNAYLDSGGVPTIGYGTTRYPDGVAVSIGDAITELQADEYFASNIVKFENAVNKFVKVKLSQNQFDALISLVYNIGIGAFQKSTLLKKLNASDFEAVPAQWMRWDKDNGKQISGLTNRRRQELGMWRGTLSKEGANIRPSAPKGKPAIKSPTNWAGVGVGAATVTATINQAKDTVQTAGDAVRAFCESPMLYAAIIILVGVAFMIWRNHQRNEEIG